MMKKLDKNNKLIIYTIIANIILAILTCILYAVLNGKRMMIYFMLIGTSFVPVAMYIFDRIFNIKFNYYIYIAVMIHLILSVTFGSSFEFYNKFIWWDLFVHGYFGYVVCVILIKLYVRFTSEKINFFVLFMLFLMTIGIAGLWELYEFVADSILGEDALRIEESILNGHSPIFDSCTDVAIAIVGVIVYYIQYFIQVKLNKSKKIEE